MKDKHIVPLVHPCIHLGANEMAPGKKQQPSGRRGSCESPMAMKYLGAYLMAVLGGKEAPTAKESLGPWKEEAKSAYLVEGSSFLPEDFSSLLFLFILNGRKNHLQGNEREA